MDISKIIDKGENMQNIREYFMKEKPGVNRKDRERTDEKNLNSDKDNIGKDMGGGGKTKKNLKSKDRPYEAEREERNKEKIIKETDKKRKEKKKYNGIDQRNMCSDRDIENINNRKMGNTNEPMMIEITKEKEPIRKGEEMQKGDKKDGFQTVIRKRRNKAFEKITKVKGIFKNIINLTEEEYGYMETKMEKF